MVKVEFIKDTSAYKIGEVIEFGEKDAREAIELGYVKYYTISEEDAKYWSAKRLVDDNGGIKNINQASARALNIDNKIYERLKLEVTKEKTDKNDLLYVDEKGKIKVSIDKVADYNIETNYIKTIFGNQSEQVWCFSNGIWICNGKENIKKTCERLLKGYCKNNIVNEVYEKIKRKTAISKDEFNTIPEGIVCLDNGLFDLKNKKLSNYDPSYFFKSKIPVKYNPNAKCIKILEFLEETLYPEDIHVIQEWLGFNLYNRYFIKKAMICFGEKDTGKTVLLNLINCFIGVKNISGISLQRIASNDKFAIASLKDKLSNIYDDLNATDLNDSGGFKIATGGGFMTGEEKFGDPFQFKNYAKHTFACNKIPPLKDIKDDAFFDRWLPIPFDNQVTEEKKDNFLLNKLTSEEELSGLFNWALEGLNRLLTNGKFTFKKSYIEIKNTMMRNNTPLASFAQDCLVKQLGNKISKEAMFQMYQIYCDKMNLAVMSKEQLGRQLSKFVPYALAKNDSNERYWEGVGLNGEIRNNSKLGGYDTFDTLLKTYRVYFNSINSNEKIIDMSFEKVSKPSEEFV